MLPTWAGVAEEPRRAVRPPLDLALEQPELAG